MRFDRYSIKDAPASLPNWQMLMDDLGNPHPKQIAKALGVSVRTAYRYRRNGRASRRACLALFWLTSWGRSQVNTQALNDCQLAAAYAKALASENDKLKSEVNRLMATGDFGAANEPLSEGDYARAG